MQMQFKVYFYSFFLILFSAQCISQEGISLANEYEKNSQYQLDLALQSLRTLQFNDDDRVLDVGCGDGKITAHIASSIPKGWVIGIDISAEMIALATAKFQIGNLIFMQGSTTNLPFKKQFDKVVSFSCLHWVREQEKALLSMVDSLKTGGQLLILLPLKSPNNLSEIAEKIVFTKKWIKHFPQFNIDRIYYHENEYIELFNSLNISIKNVKVFDSIYLHKNRQALFDYLKPLVTFTKHLSCELQEEFLKDVVNEMIVINSLNEDETIPVKNIEIEVFAIKN